VDAKPKPLPITPEAQELLEEFQEPEPTSANPQREPESEQGQEEEIKSPSLSLPAKSAVKSKSPNKAKKRSVTMEDKSEKSLSPVLSLLALLVHKYKY